MVTQPARSILSKGTCTFCKMELAKNKMTQHLKSCKARLATLARQGEPSQEPKIRWFHLLAEGQYNPHYWLHFELPASESLWSVDGFLKAMWIDDLDHLSGFTINGTDYSTDEPDAFYAFHEGAEPEAETLAEEGHEEAMSELVGQVVSSWAEGLASSLGIAFNPDLLSSEWIAELNKPRSAEELVDFLKAERASLLQAEKLARKDEQELSREAQRASYLTKYFQKMVVEELLEAVEDRSLEVALERVLTVGQKFSYIY